jgi:hypothetical protein
MGKMKVDGGGAQVVQYRTASGHTSSRLAYNQSEELEINDSGDQLWLDFCFLTCGSPSSGPADVLPGDYAMASAGLWKGVCLRVFRGDKEVYSKWSNGEPCG